MHELFSKSLYVPWLHLLLSLVGKNTSVSPCDSSAVLPVFDWDHLFVPCAQCHCPHERQSINLSHQRIRAAGKPHFPNGTTLYWHCCFTHQRQLKAISGITSFMYIALHIGLQVLCMSYLATCPSRSINHWSRAPTVYLASPSATQVSLIGAQVPRVHY